MGLGETGGETGGGGIGGKTCAGDGCVVSVGADGEEISTLRVEWKGRYWWSFVTALERPPKDEDIVLNSTCFISGVGEDSEGSA